MTQLAQNVPEQLPASLQWQSPAGEVSITMEAEVVERLRHDVLAGFRALPKRGMEVGGVLLGRVTSARPLAITVEQVEPIPCEHLLGPAFILSDSDRTQLARQLAEPRQDGLAVLGFYRSCTGREMGLDATDEDIIGEFWPDPAHVFLVIQPVSMHECVAGFVFRRNGRLPTTPQHAPFPFRTGPPVTAVLEEAEPPVEHNEARADQPQEPAVTDRVHAPLPDDPQPWPRRRLEEAEPRRRIWPWVLACVTLAIAVLGGREVWDSFGEPRWSQLGLNVSSAQSGLEVSWDPSVPEVQNARWGVLTIVDSDSNSEVELNKAALARGTFTYRRSGNDVLVRFRVGGTHTGVFGETFRFVSETKQTPASASDVARRAGTVQPPQAETSPSDASEPVRSRQSLAAEAQSTPDDGQKTPTEPSNQPPAKRNLRVAFPAKAVRESQPFVPEGIRGRIQDRIVVPVTVRINSVGQVTSAVSEGDGDTVYRYLASRAAQSAKLWRFEPARSARGVALESTKTLHFVFTR